MPNAYTRTTTISLTEGERAELASMARSRSLPAALALALALALRARIVLACEGEDTASTDVAQALGISRATVTKWRGRYLRTVLREQSNCRAIALTLSPLRAITCMV